MYTQIQRKCHLQAFHRISFEFGIVCGAVNEGLKKSLQHSRDNLWGTCSPAYTTCFSNIAFVNLHGCDEPISCKRQVASASRVVELGEQVVQDVDVWHVLLYTLKSMKLLCRTSWPEAVALQSTRHCQKKGQIGPVI